MSGSIKRHLEAVISWGDKGFDSGSKNAKQRIDAMKKAVREMALAVTALIATLSGATFALYKMVEAGSKIQDQAETFDLVRERAGLLPDTLKRIADATRGTVTDMKIMQLSTRALNDELEPGRLVEFWAKAKQISEASGADVAQVFEMLYLAVAKGQTRMLTQIGITLDAEDAATKYAASIGKTTEELTFRDRQYAVSMALEEKYIKQFKSLGELGNDSAEMFEQVGVKVRNLKDKFLMMLADSPSVERFLTFLVDKLDGMSEALDRAEPKIAAVVDNLTKFYEAIASFIDQKAEPAINWVTRYKEELLGLGAALVTTGGLMRFGVPAPIAGGIGAGVGIGTFIGAEAASWEAELAKMNRELVGQGIPNFEALVQKAREAGIAVDELTQEGLRNLILQLNSVGAASVRNPLVITNEPTFPGEKPKDADVWKRTGGTGKAPGPWEDTEDLLDQNLKYYAVYYDEMTAMAQQHVDTYKGLVLGKEQWEVELMYEQLEAERRGMQMRAEVWQAGFGAMGRYSDRFYNHSAHMGRVLNSMLIAGMTEMVASYIELKTKQARMDFMEASYQAIRALAMGDLRAASLYAQAAAGAGLVAGAGAIAAGWVRNYGQEKADAITGEQERQWNEATAAESETGTQRKRATGVVNTRPIAINGYSGANFNAGNMVFGDSEEAANDLYEQCIRDKINDDVETGMIAIPA